MTRSELNMRDVCITAGHCRDKATASCDEWQRSVHTTPACFFPLWLGIKEERAVGALKVLLIYLLLPVICLNMDSRYIRHLCKAKQSKPHLVFSSLVLSATTGRWPSPTWRGHVHTEPSLTRAVVRRSSFFLPIGCLISATHHCQGGGSPNNKMTFFYTQGWI